MRLPHLPRRIPRLRPSIPDAGTPSTLPPKLVQRFTPAIENLLREPSRRILAGPWLSEVGWEVLYWIPLLRWSVQRWPELRERLVVVSRGGVRAWYDGVAAEYVDLFERYDDVTFARKVDLERTAKRERGENAKQAYVTEWEREIAAWVAQRLDEPDLPMLHPSILFPRGKKLVLALGAADEGFARWRRPERGPLADLLPDRFVAVRFYDSTMMRDQSGDSAAAAAFADAAIRAIATRVPVVALDPGVAPDRQHSDFRSDAHVVRIGHRARPENNLEIQSIAIAHAAAYVGTFGGLGFLAPHYGVPSVCFWAATHRGVPESGHGPWRDLALASRVYNRPGWGGFSARHIDEAPLEELLAPVFAAAR